MVDGLLDWRDPDMEPRPLGAESEYYYDLDDPYPVKNGPLSSVEELKRIKGWEIIFDSARPDPYLRFTAEELRVPLLADPYEAQLLLDSLTAWSTTAETAPDGQPKIDLASADAQSITERGISGIAQNQANAIAAFNAYTSVTDLIDVLGNYELATQVVDYFTYNPDAGSTVDQAIAAIDQTAAQINLGGGLVINQAAGQEDQTGVAPGSVNLNTAPYETLMALPGMTEDLAWTIIDAREEEPFQIGSQIAQLPNMTEESFRGIYPFVGATTSLFRVVSEGIESSTGVKVTITAALRVVNGEVLVAHWKVD
jgi:DNA uptake protein ComE-like DNA-binding protein